MKKFFLSFVLGLYGALFASAQGSVSATLSHDGNITVFYGVNALQQAHKAANGGDVITLSSGTFQATDLTKAVTLRGAGMDVNSKDGIDPTIITGDFRINVSDTLSHRLTVEGIYHGGTITGQGALKNAMFMKSRFNALRFDNGILAQNCSFLHCRINEIRIDDDAIIGISSFLGYIAGDGTATLYNCVVSSFSTNGWYHIYNKALINCLINVGHDTDRPHLSNGSSAYNCVGFGEYSDRLFSEIPNTTNVFVADATTLFKTFDGANGNDFETFELTEEAQKKYVGRDGTQVGLHGGSLPYDPVPNMPRIVRCNVAAKSTADGKLSVDIAVKAAE